MILELDCGNSLIKWRIFDIQENKVLFFGAAPDECDLLRQINNQPFDSFEWGRLVSVRSDAETLSLIRVLERSFSIDLKTASSRRELAGVENGYEDFNLLGADRWLATVAAFHIVNAACLVLDIGTAVTADYVTSEGKHLGGYICPGVSLMRSQLGGHTRRIKYEASAVAHCNLPGRSTAEAVERGSELMLEGFILTQLNKARAFWGDSFRTILTGGDAHLIERIAPDALVVPDLVFRGLAIACPA